MLRRGIAALMMGVICAGSVTADDAATDQLNSSRSGVIGWLRPKATSPARNAVQREPAELPAGGVQRAVIADAERQAAQVQVSQTASQVADDVVVVSPYTAAPQPVPIELPPALPNQNMTAGPQYFSAVPTNGFSNPVPVHPGQNWQHYTPPVPVHQAAAGHYSPVARAGMAAPAAMSIPGQPVAETRGQYPQVGAALYPAPVPGIPQQIGGTLIPNQAFHPHEMLYAHRYRAMYPPYYYKVNGGWIVTPFGVWSHEDWKLQGTTVDVRYKSSISPFALYKRPVTK